MSPYRHNAGEQLQEVGMPVSEVSPPKKSVWERVAGALDLPADIVARLPRIEIVGCRRLFMENHQGILEYGDEAVHINGGQVIVKIKGQGLELSAMNAVELSLKGLILGIEFEF